MDEYIKKSKGQRMFENKTKPISYVINDEIYNSIYQYGMMTMLNSLYVNKAIDEETLKAFLKYDSKTIRDSVALIINDEF